MNVVSVWPQKNVDAFTNIRDFIYQSPEIPLQRIAEVLEKANSAIFLLAMKVPEWLTKFLCADIGCSSQDIVIKKLDGTTEADYVLNIVSGYAHFDSFKKIYSDNPDQFANFKKTNFEKLNKTGTFFIKTSSISTIYPIEYLGGPCLERWNFKVFPLNYYRDS